LLTVIIACREISLILAHQLGLAFGKTPTKNSQENEFLNEIHETMAIDRFAVTFTRLNERWYQFVTVKKKRGKQGRRGKKKETRKEKKKEV
jgi:hypothetical protein